MGEGWQYEDGESSVRIDVDFVVQDGECGPQTFGMRASLYPETFHHYPDNDYLEKVVMPQMADGILRNIRQHQDDGKLWEGAYLVTHPDDAP